MKKKETLLVCLIIIAFVTFLTPTCLAVDEGTSETISVSNEDVIDIIINSLYEENTFDISDEKYEMIRLYIKTHESTEILVDGTILWVLSETYTLVLKPDRSLELQNGDVVIKDRYAKWQTIDFAGLAEPAFNIIGFAGGTWMFDDIEGALRFWVLGEQQVIFLQRNAKNHKIQQTP